MTDEPKKIVLIKQPGTIIDSETLSKLNAVIADHPELEIEILDEVPLSMAEPFDPRIERMKRQIIEGKRGRTPNRYPYPHQGLREWERRKNGHKAHNGKN